MTASDPNRPIRAALLGAGYIADWHAGAIKATPGVELVAVCDRSEAAAEALAQTYGITAYSDLDAMLAAGVADAVHIVTPPQTHRALAEACLRGGVHVVVEKPVALSGQETREIADIAEETGRIFAAGHNFMGTPGYQRLKNRLESGAIGRVAATEINWHFPLAPLRSGPFGLWLLQEPKNLLLELGPHLFAFAVDLFGDLDVHHVALSKPVAIPGDTDRPQGFRILASARDVSVTINLSLVETMDDRSVTLHGSTARARYDYAHDVLVVDGDNAADIVANPFLRQMGLAGQHLREGMVNGARQLASLNRKSPYGLSFAGLSSAFYAAIRSGRPLDTRFDGASAVKVMTAIDAANALLPKPEKKPKPATRAKPKPTVLIIGGTGFIGRALTRAWVAKGRDVRVLSRGQSGPFDDIADHVELFGASLTDPEQLAAAFDGIEIAYHLGKSMDATWEAALKNDVEVTETIARAANAAGVTRFVYTGTIASYDMSDPEVTITEASDFGDMETRNIYARSKAECEARLLELHRKHDLPLVIARPGIVVGKGGPLQHWGIGRWHGAGAVRIWGNGKHILPFVLNDDVADALILMAEEDAAIGESFNLVGEPMLSARDYFDAIAARLGARIKVRSGHLPVFYASATVKHLLKKHVLRRGGLTNPSLADWQSRAHFSPFDNDRPKRLLGWQPEPRRDAFLTKAVDEADLLGF
ncbi:NAD-dependent epimerase/dehydratase family protein [Shimia sp. Alg240-R146]|uniref:NAD-dependent epimerase/dehydratase family protein n=1 Tax=Shimia sp. Alg240-R146 TaxID=2993449 RepID=UPI0022DEF412|nr:NAD-dependent epimerase/dehydratase family protein [Shimia sp. Alg240-R146]